MPVFDEIKLLKSNLGMLTIPTIKLCDVNHSGSEPRTYRAELGEDF